MNHFLGKPDELQRLILEKELPELVFGLRSHIVELTRSLGNVDSIDSPVSFNHSSFLTDGILENLEESGLLGRFNIRPLAKHGISNQHIDKVVEVVDSGGLHHGCFSFSN